MIDQCQCGRTRASCAATMSDCCTNCQHRSSTVEPAPHSHVFVVEHTLGGDLFCWCGEEQRAESDPDQ